MTGKSHQGLPHGTSRQRVSGSALGGIQPQARKPRQGKAVKPSGEKPVEVLKAFVVSGGFLKHSHVVPTVEFDGKHFVKAANSENWLCKSATGKCRSLAPLARTTVIDHLHGMLSEMEIKGVVEVGAFAPAGQPKADHEDDMASFDLDGKANQGGSMALDSGMRGLGLDCAMSGFGLDATSPPRRDVPPPSRQRGRARSAAGSQGVAHLLLRQRARKQAARRAKKDKPRVIDVALPKDWQRNGVSSVQLLTRPPRQAALKRGILIGIEAVPWLVGQARLEASAGGVTFQPKESSMAKPHFSYRDKAWVARAKLPNGQVARRYFNVSVFVDLPDGRKRPAIQQEIEERKEVALQEAMDWQAVASDGQ